MSVRHERDGGRERKKPVAKLLEGEEGNHRWRKRERERRSGSTAEMRACSVWWPKMVSYCDLFAVHLICFIHVFLSPLVCSLFASLSLFCSPLYLSAPIGHSPFRFPFFSLSCLPPLNRFSPQRTLKVYEAKHREVCEKARGERRRGRKEEEEEREDEQKTEERQEDGVETIWWIWVGLLGMRRRIGTLY